MGTVLSKSLEIILTVLLEKLLNWLLKADNRQQFMLFGKMQILVLYLDWVLLKTPLLVLPDDDQTDE